MKKEIAIVSICFILFIGLVIILNANIVKTKLQPDDNVSFEKATVIEELSSGGSSSNETADGQTIKAKIRSGKHKGETCEAFNSNGYLYGADCQPGTKVILQLSEHGETLSANVYGYDREMAIYIFVAIFLIILSIIGGVNGIRSAIALVFTFACIIGVYIPLLYIGVSPFLAAILVVVITTIATMYLIAGRSKKTLCAILGTIGGVTVSGIFAVLFGHFGHISGYNVEEIESLIYVGQSCKLQIGGLLFSGILISSLGAVMDVSMSIVSTIQEIMEQSPHISRKQLFKSGITVGKDMMGTMSNTLILAFTGGSINTLIMLYAYNMPYNQMINMYSIGIEVLQGISGTLGVILTVPFASIIASAFIYKNKTEQS